MEGSYGDRDGWRCAGYTPRAGVRRPLLIISCRTVQYPTARRILPPPVPVVAGGGSKVAVLETGASIQVPLFINNGELIKIDTRTEQYLSRAKE